MIQTIRASISLDLFGDGVELGPDGAPIAFRIWSFGEHCTDKGDWLFTLASAAALMSSQAERGNLYSIDVDHLSFNPEAPLENHKAVGWHRLALRGLDDAPELWAVDVEWTPLVKPGLCCSPPEWRYFSPNYGVNTETREVTRYFNTALTNNPATHHVTALAASVAATLDEVVMAKVDIDATLAALRAGADSDDEMQSKRCRAALAAFHASNDGDADDSKDEKKEASESSDDEEKKEASESSDESKDEKKETSVAASIDLAKALHETRAELAAFKESVEREKLLASRPDFDATVRATLEGAPLSVVKKAVSTWKRVAASQVEAARAATDTTVRATTGETQGETVSRLPADQARELRVQMGLEAEAPRFGLEGTRHVMATMTPAQARAELARREAAKNAQVSK